MPHPSITRWVDFVRGLVGEAERGALRRHLDSGCRRCGQSVAALESVASSARADARGEPPAGVLRSVKALAALHRPESRPRLGAQILALACDSGREAALQGVRSGDSTGRQLLFESGEYALDLSVEPSADPTARVVAGSCLRQTSAPIVGAAVLALGEGGVAAGTTTGELGEFVFEELPSAACELWLFAPGGRPLVAAVDLSS